MERKTLDPIKLAAIAKLFRMQKTFRIGCANEPDDHSASAETFEPSKTAANAEFDPAIAADIAGLTKHYKPAFDAVDHARRQRKKAAITRAAGRVRQREL